MFLMYVDESGDVGLVNSPTRYYVLSGVVVHELRWRPVLDKLVEFRRRVKDEHGLKLREELHAAAMINDPGLLVRIKRHHRLAIVRDFADALGSIADLSVINVVVDKQGKDATYDVFASAWKALVQCLDATISHRDVSGARHGRDRAMIFPDHTDNKRLQELLRILRVYNPIPNEHGGGYRNTPITRVIEDPVFRRSEDSYLVQAADLCAFLLYQHIAPSAYMRKKSGQNYFDRLVPICAVASAEDPRGIIWL